MKVQNSSSSDIFIVNHSGNVSIGNSNNSNRLDVSGDTRLRGNLTVDSALSVGSLASDTFVYNSGGNANFKITSNAGSIRMEVNGTPDLTIWNNSNRDIAVFGNNRVCYFKNSIETTGNSTTSAICYASAHVPTSSVKYKKNIRESENNNLINKLEFKSYDKIISKEDEDEITFKDCGLIIENLEQDEFLKTFIHKHNDMKYLNYNGIFCNLFSELISEIKNLKNEIANLKK